MSKNIILYKIFLFLLDAIITTRLLGVYLRRSLVLEWLRMYIRVCTREKGEGSVGVLFGLRAGRYVRGRGRCAQSWPGSSIEELRMMGVISQCRCVAISRLSTTCSKI